MTTTIGGAAAPTHEAVLAVLRAELAVVAPDLDPGVAAGASLKHDLSVDSLSVLELVARIEYRFGLSVPDEDWPLLGSLDAIAAYVVAGGPT
jgi:acyl carrier protein